MMTSAGLSPQPLHIDRTLTVMAESDWQENEVIVKLKQHFYETVF